jgi:esterase/lipase superfamily enzyme
MGRLLVYFWRYTPVILCLFAFRAPSTCAQTNSQGASDLMRQRLALEERLGEARKTGLADDDPTLRELEEQLLTVRFQEDAAERQEAAATKGFSSSDIQVPVYFITTRSKDRTGRFGSTPRANGYSLGIAVTKIPVSYAVRKDLFPAPEANISLEGVPSVRALAGESELINAIAKDQKDSSGRKRRVLLFIHGYNVNFEAAINATARLATEVQYSVIPVALDWTSAGHSWDYWQDEDNVRAATVDLTPFLRDFLTNSSLEVDIVCHSMGARLVTTALAQLAGNGVKLKALKRVAFGAGDISTDEFARQWPTLLGLQGVQFTFYVSDSDLALWASHVVIHHIPRLGDAGSPPFIPEGGTTVDASNLRDLIDDPFGHSYLYESPRVGADLGSWIDGHQSPLQRGLEQITSGENAYYVIP